MIINTNIYKGNSDMNKNKNQKKPRFVELWILGNLSNIFTSRKDTLNYINQYFGTYGSKNFEIREII